MSCISTILHQPSYRTCRGLSPLKLRSMNASVKGISAASAGTMSPHAPSSATAQVERSTVLLPAMLGPGKYKKARVFRTKLQF